MSFEDGGGDGDGRVLVLCKLGQLNLSCPGELFLFIFTNDLHNNFSLSIDFCGFIGDCTAGILPELAFYDLSYPLRILDIECLLSDIFKALSYHWKWVFFRLAFVVFFCELCAQMQLFLLSSEGKLFFVN